VREGKTSFGEVRGTALRFLGPWPMNHPAPLSEPVATLAALRLPLPWDEFDLPNPLQTATTVLMTGDIGWAWHGATPDLPIPAVPSPAIGVAAEGWDLDHVVLLAPSLDAVVAAMAAVGCEPRLRMEVGGRPAAFFRVGPVLEVIESPVRQAVIYGVALTTTESLEVVALRWRALGREVTEPRPAAQPGRRIMTVQATEAGLAIMTPDRSGTPPAAGAPTRRT